MESCETSVGMLLLINEFKFYEHTMKPLGFRIEDITKWTEPGEILCYASCRGAKWCVLLWILDVLVTTD